MELLLILVALGMLIAVLTAIAIIGRWILGPIDRAAKDREAAVRFSIGDFLCLFLTVQIPLSLIYRLVDEEEKPLFWLFTVITWVLAPLVWFACARALSKAGITGGRQRMVFLGVIVPFVYYGLLPFLFLTLAGAIVLAQRASIYLGGFGWNIVGRVPQGAVAYSGRIGWYVVAWILLAAAFYLAGLFTRTMVRQARGGERSLTEWERQLELARVAISSISESNSSPERIHEQSCAGASLYRRQDAAGRQQAL